MQLEDAIGHKFNRLTVLSDEGILKRYRACKVRCDCGNEFITIFSNVKSGRKASCGCLVKDRLKKQNYRHGATHHPHFARWNMIRSRCYNKSNRRYLDYGGRGIEMCDEWKNDPFTFFAWMEKQGYKDGLTVDRIDNDGNYSPDNCRLVTKAVQNRNRRERRHYQGKPIKRN